MSTRVQAIDTMLRVASALLQSADPDMQDEARRQVNQLSERREKLMRQAQRPTTHKRRIAHAAA